MAYSKEVVKRFESVLQNPEAHSVGRFDPKDGNVATGMIGAPACGDVMSSTMFVEMLKGKTIEEAKLIKDKDIAEALDLPPIKLHCSVLAEGSIKSAIEDWERKTQHRRNNQCMTT